MNMPVLTMENVAAVLKTVIKTEKYTFVFGNNSNTNKNTE